MTAGCWVGYALIYPVSSLPLPRYTLVGVVVLGVYLDTVAETMLERLLAVFGSGVGSYAIGVTIYALPGLLNWYSDPVVRRSLYLTGLRKAFIFGLLATTLLLFGTFLSYVLRNAYDELSH